MVLRRSIKALLVVLVVGVAIAVVSSFLTRSRSLPTPPNNELLPDDVESRGTDFDHTEFKLGKILFRVRSQTDIVSDQGVRQLQDVELLVFGEEGEVQDAVTGQEATYWVEDKKIELRKEVEIRLADGTTIFSDRLQGDLGREIIQIQQGFTFERSRARGKGRELTYRIGDRHLNIDRSFQMHLVTGDNLLEARSERVEYQLDQGLLDLLGEAGIRGRAETLSADRILVEMNPENQVRHVDARGNARFVGPPHQFKGARIFIRFSESGEGATEFWVESGTPPEVGERLRASYRQEGPAGSQHLSADRIDLRPAAGVTSTTNVRLRTFVARGDVRFASRTHFVENSRSDQASGEFHRAGHLQSVILKGDVEIHRIPPQGDAQHLTSPQVTSRFEGGKLRETYAKGPVRLDLRGSGEVRSLQAATSLRMLFEQGEARQLAARGSVRVESRGDGLESTLDAPQLDASFENGQLKSLVAGLGVRLHSRQPDRSRISTSRTLEAEFQSGALSRIEQKGDFLLIEEVGRAKTELKAAEGRFNVVAHLLQTAGDQVARLRQWDNPESPPVVTTAWRFLISHRDRTVTAEGSVTSEFLDREAREPVLITAERMQAGEDTDWILYDRGSPRIQTENSRATGRQIRLQKSNGLLRVEGEVDSYFRQTSPEGETEYRVQAERLDLDRAAGHALYNGTVQARSQKMLLKAPHLELFLLPGSDDKVEKIRAWDGVEIIEPTRTAIGDVCFYFPEENLVRLMGDPARVTDDKQGKASGPVLLFNPGTDTLVIESSLGKTP